MLPVVLTDIGLLIVFTGVISLVKPLTFLGVSNRPWAVGVLVAGLLVAIVATRLPASRFHFLNDVMEAVIDYLVAGNSSNITHFRNGYGLYPKPLLALTEPAMTSLFQSVHLQNTLLK